MSTRKTHRGWGSGGGKTLLMDKNPVSGRTGGGGRSKTLKYSQLLLATRKKQDKLWLFRSVTRIQIFILPEALILS